VLEQLTSRARQYFIAGLSNLGRVLEEQRKAVVAIGVGVFVGE